MSLLGRTNDDNHFSLLFPVPLGGVTSHWLFVRALRPKGTALSDRLNVISVNTIEEMVVRIKSYIDLQIEKEGRKNHKESTKDVHKGNMPEQRLYKSGHDVHKGFPILPCPYKEVHETFTSSKSRNISYLDQDGEDGLRDTTDTMKEAPILGSN